MEVTSNKLEKELEKIRCEMLVRQEISNIKFNTDIHKKVMSFVVLNIFLSFFFAWCSSSDTSNLPQYVSSHEWAKIVIAFFPHILWIIFGVALVWTAKNRRKKVEFKSSMTKFSWDKKYQRFILKKMGFETYDSFSENMDEMKRMYDTAPDVEFYEDEFEKYIEESYKKFEIDVSFDFYKNLAKFILLENELKKSLISEGDKYTFIPKDNPEFLVMATVNL